MDIPNYIRLARTNLCLNSPYLSSAIFRMTFIESTEVPTMGVDKNWNCYFNPEFGKSLDVKQCAAVIEHEVWHLLRDHANRTQVDSSLSPEDSHMKWNIAADCEINDDIKNLPPNCVYPETYSLERNNIAEWYWDKLPKNPSKSGGGKGNGSGEGKNKNGFGGSCADGQKRSWEGDFDKSNISSVEKKQIAKMVAEEIKQHNASRGSVPAGMLRWANQQLAPPIVDYKKEIRCCLRSYIQFFNGFSDTTFSKINRHQSVYGDIVKPGMISFLPKIAIVVDTSGSMSDKMLSSCLNEIHHVLKTVQNEVYIVSCDAQAYAAQRVLNTAKVKLMGGGGTDMTEGIKAAHELNPNIVILLTDGYTGYPEKSPDRTVKHLTVILCKDGAKPSFGKVVYARNLCD